MSIQLGYQNKCDIEIALLSEYYNVIHGVDTCQGLVLLKIILCKQDNAVRAHGQCLSWFVDYLRQYRQKTKSGNSCPPASMQGILAFSVSYITIHAKLVLLLMKRQMAYRVGPIMTEERPIEEIWRSVQDSISCAISVLTCMISIFINSPTSTATALTRLCLHPGQVKH